MFILHYNSNLCCVATAEHVIDHADNWKQPIKLVHHETGEHIFLKEDDRVIYRDGDKDSAVILFLKPNFKLPEVPVALLPEGNLIKKSTKCKFEKIKILPSEWSS